MRKKIFRITKPSYTSFGRWERWQRVTKKEHPYAWFVTETVPIFIEKIVSFFLDPIIDRKNKWVMKRIVRPHLLNTKLNETHHHEYKKKFLYALFNELVDYVEVILANRWVGWSVVQERKYKFPAWRKHWWLNWRPWRCAAAGIDSLKWQADLSESDVATGKRTKIIVESAQEIMLLYSWWVYVRPQRMDSWKQVGLEQFMHELNEKYGIDTLRVQWTADEELTYRRLLDQQEQLEFDWEHEDHNMLIRLVNIAPHLIY
jgi:hypothetical protein